MEINAEISKRHSIIIEPNVPVIIGKTKNRPELLGAYEGVTKAKIKDYLKDRTIKYKKILTTPESYHLIQEACQDKAVRINLYTDFFCLYDECEKLIQDIDYRESITQPMDDFFLFNRKAMVSATPILPGDPRFEEQGFQILKVEPQYDYRKDLNIIDKSTLFFRPICPIIQ